MCLKHRAYLGVAGLALLVIAAACSAAPDAPSSSSEAASAGPRAPRSARQPPAEAAATSEPTPAAPAAAPETKVSEPTPAVVEESKEPEVSFPFSTFGWKTDFSKSNIDFSELFSGGPPKDGIPAIDDPTFEAVAEVAFPFSVLEKEPVVHYTLAGEDLVVFCKKGTASALDDQFIADSYDVGATNIFRPVVDGQKLTFTAQGENFVEEETGTTWNLLGQAIEGPLKGSALTPVVQANHLWFAWGVFKPDTVVYQGAAEG